MAKRARIHHSWSRFHSTQYACFSSNAVSPTPNKEQNVHKTSSTAACCSTFVAIRGAETRRTSISPFLVDALYRTSFSKSIHPRKNTNDRMSTAILSTARARIMCPS